ncbi:hypothetical protein RZS28_18730 (plasmid) [Methylocapsa polymorpha]|uniref:Uncharacterized protein n=1 Tax=Methylocapsa polymorpha TaxID=3080828 RepID=A0ABZ0HXY0_9HYPH|nr:hypothetical protein RZS28_18730 [Methylocapsa sp. RX1]
MKYEDQDFRAVHLTRARLARLSPWSIFGSSFLNSAELKTGTAVSTGRDLVPLSK